MILHYPGSIINRTNKTGYSVFDIISIFEWSFHDYWNNGSQLSVYQFYTMFADILAYHAIGSTEYSKGLYNRERLDTLDANKDTLTISARSSKWIIEPQNVKTYKMTSAPSEDSDQPGRFWLAWANAQTDQSLRCAKNTNFLHADAQADLSIRWAHRLFCWFCPAAAQWYTVDGGSFEKTAVMLLTIPHLLFLPLVYS